MQAESYSPIFTLRDAILALDPFDRQRLASIHIRPARGGFEARFRFAGMMPAVPIDDMPAGVAGYQFEAQPDSVAMLTWRTPAWDQILAVVQDESLTLPGELGSLEAVERAADAGAPEGACQWFVTTHGAARSEERVAWIRSLTKGGK